ncbi:conjugal transfer protein [Listeria booriae]|uniref:Conjugal transfer protein n=1 Tax=Listeria booriae TaxID=1552123 RepID=A0A842GB41_9LIST|nr:conjugal transfer protein [Listeria booriae]MBC2294733.1 conjugal transfer protein [Listeria booriae]
MFKKKNEEQRETKDSKGGFFQGIKKEKPKKKALKRDKSKLIATCIWFMLGSLLCVSLFSIWYTNKAQRMGMPQVEVDEKAKAVPVVNETEADYYGMGFVQAYMNVPKDSEALKARQEKLTAFMVTNTTNTAYDFGTTAGVGTRIFVDSRLRNTKQTKDGILLTYKVAYKNVVTEQKEVMKDVQIGKTKKKVKTMVPSDRIENKVGFLNIHIVGNGKGLAIKDLPYWSMDKTLQATIEVGNKTPTPYRGEDEQKISDFVTTFFTKYAASPAEDMAYMMKEPESLAGTFVFESVDQLVIVKKGGVLSVTGRLLMQDATTKIPVQEAFTLSLEKRDSNYYVLELKHEEDFE